MPHCESKRPTCSEHGETLWNVASCKIIEDHGDLLGFLAMLISVGILADQLL